MLYELSAITENGRRLVRLAEELSADFATRAAAHDRDGSYPFENIEALRDTGYLYSPFPRPCGGLGVETVHDVVVGVSRLARGDASVTIGANMHLIGALGLTRQWCTALNTGKETRAAAATAAMERMVQSGDIASAAVSEPNQDLTRPQTTARRTSCGWVINGLKIFGTMSPAATKFNVAVTVVGEEGGDRYAFAQVPRNATGVTVNDDWDALGMRASGSGSIVFDNVHVPEKAVGRGWPAGEINAELLESFLVSGSMHGGASLGIAEAAHEQVLTMAATRKGSHRKPMAERAGMQILAAENAIDLMAMRAALDRAGRVVDDYYAANPGGRGSLDDVSAALAEVQSAKALLNRAAVQLVDRALTMSGGAGFMNKHPLSRHYRDARAGAFMHPFGANVAFEYIGQVTLGAEVTIG